MPIIDLGKVVGDPGASMRFRGDWNNESEYFNNASYIDAVTHNGSLWICKATNTNQVPAIGTYWGIGAQGMAEDNMVFSAYSAFPSVGDENKLYIDNTVNPALMYIWDGSAYVPAGGGGEVAAEDVTYDNASSGLTAQTVQEAIDENAEAISALNSSFQGEDISADCLVSKMGDMSITYATRRGTHYSISAAFRNISAGGGDIATLKSDYCPKDTTAIAVCAYSGGDIAVASGWVLSNGNVRFTCSKTAVTVIINMEYDVPNS